ncbi:MAG: DUF4199 domain-containing protein [Bacteroidales bacterium]|nr:DUF4199 domain-containing protein [Bacteroidales bacterium]
MAIFHRYHSTIHGNYRAASLRGGALVGGLMALYVAVRLLVGNPSPSPVTLPVDVALMVAIVLLAAHYRATLPGKLITLKETMLFGIGTAGVAGLVYGAALWLLCLLSANQTVMFTNTMTQNAINEADPQLHYWAAWWAIVAAVSTAVLGAFAAFLAAIMLRNEKSETITKK